MASNNDAPIASNNNQQPTTVRDAFVLRFPLDSIGFFSFSRVLI
jgi:hypothetical protein